MFALRAALGRFWSSDCSVSIDFGRSVGTGAARGGVEFYVFYDVFFCVLLGHFLCAEISAALRKALHFEGI